VLLRSTLASDLASRKIQIKKNALVTLGAASVLQKIPKFSKPYISNGLCSPQNSF
jgi:hypothetical protein